MRSRVSNADAGRISRGIVPDPLEDEAPPHEQVEPEGPFEDDDADVEATPRPLSDGRWGPVIERVFSIDPQEAYPRLERELTLGDKATRFAEVLPALDRADANMLEAVRLARLASLEDERVSAEVARRKETLRTAAKAELDKEVRDSYDEKLKKTTKKAPTIQDIEDRIVANWPDENEALETRKSRAHGAVRVMEALAEAWRSRANSLRKIMERVAPLHRD